MNRQRDQPEDARARRRRGNEELAVMEKWKNEMLSRLEDLYVRPSRDDIDSFGQWLLAADIGISMYWEDVQKLEFYIHKNVDLTNTGSHFPNIQTANDPFMNDYFVNLGRNHEGGRAFSEKCTSLAQENITPVDYKRLLEIYIETNAASRTLLLGACVDLKANGALPALLKEKSRVHNMASGAQRYQDPLQDVRTTCTGILKVYYRCKKLNEIFQEVDQHMRKQDSQTPDLDLLELKCVPHNRLFSLLPECYGIEQQRQDDRSSNVFIYQQENLRSMYEDIQRECFYIQDQNQTIVTGIMQMRGARRKAMEEMEDIKTHHQALSRRWKGLEAIKKVLQHRLKTIQEQKDKNGEKEETPTKTENIMNHKNRKSDSVPETSLYEEQHFDPQSSTFEDKYYTPHNHGSCDLPEDLRLNTDVKPEDAKRILTLIHLRCQSAKKDYMVLVNEISKITKPRYRYASNVSREHGQLQQEKMMLMQYISDLEHSVGQITRDNIDAMNQLTAEQLAKEKQWYQKDCATQHKNAELDQKVDELKQDNEQLKLQHGKQNHQKILKEQNEIILVLKQRYDTLQRQKEQQQLQNTAEKQQYEEEVMKREKRLIAEKENLLTRLSKIAGGKLTQGNPAITDLSDPNRPTKLAERYSELYDNEWTDAMEELSDGVCRGNDDVGVQMLCRILQEAFTFCSKMETMYRETVLQSVTTLPVKVEPDSSTGRTHDKSCITLTAEQNKQIDDLKQMCVPMLSESVKSEYLRLMNTKFEYLYKDICRQNGHVREESKASWTDEDEDDVEMESLPRAVTTSDKYSSSLSEYATKDYDLSPSPIGRSQMSLSANVYTTKFATACVDLCWWMRISNPPLHLDIASGPGSVINFDIYKAYTQKGQRVDFHVWPALYLLKGGPLLCKGIVQPAKE